MSANYPAPIHRGRGIVFDRFPCIFVSLFTGLRENGWTDLHEIFREGVERPWDDRRCDSIFGQFVETGFSPFKPPYL